MRINHRRIDVAMTKQELDGPDVGTVRKQMGRKRMAKRVDTGMFVYFRFRQSGLECPLYGRIGRMPAQHSSGFGTRPDCRGGKDELPCDTAGRARIFPVQGSGQGSESATIHRILLV